MKPATQPKGLERKLACPEGRVPRLKRLLYGPRRERLTEDSNQQHLFDSEAVASVPVTEPVVESQTQSPKGTQGTWPPAYPRSRATS